MRSRIVTTCIVLALFAAACGNSGSGKATPTVTTVKGEAPVTEPGLTCRRTCRPRRA
jgi:hypothetical protein